jgi:hypothetical protein
MRWQSRIRDDVALLFNAIKDIEMEIRGWYAHRNDDP